MQSIVSVVSAGYLLSSEDSETHQFRVNCLAAAGAEVPNEDSTFFEAMVNLDPAGWLEACFCAYADEESASAITVMKVDIEPTKTVSEVTEQFSEEPFEHRAYFSALNAVRSERAYQDYKFGGTASGGHPGDGERTLDEFCVYIAGYAKDLVEMASKGANGDDILAHIRKVTALGFHAMEQHGAPQRKGFQVPKGRVDPKRRALIVHGPPGCGKTYHAYEIADAFGFSEIVDGWKWEHEMVEGGKLYLTNLTPTEFWSRSGGVAPGLHVEVRSFDSVMSEVVGD